MTLKDKLTGTFVGTALGAAGTLGAAIGAGYWEVYDKVGFLSPFAIDPVKSIEVAVDYGPTILAITASAGLIADGVRARVRTYRAHQTRYNENKR